jgi:hypothetical protein
MYHKKKTRYTKEPRRRRLSLGNMKNQRRTGCRVIPEMTRWKRILCDHPVSEEKEKGKSF